MSQSYTNYFTYATSRPSPLQIASWSGKYALEIRGERLEVRGEIGEIGGVGAIRAIGRVTFVGMHGTYNRCRDARSERPSPLKVTELYVLSFDNGRTDRASLQDIVTASGVRWVKGYSISGGHSDDPLSVTRVAHPARRLIFFDFPVFLLCGSYVSSATAVFIPFLKGAIY